MYSIFPSACNLCSWLWEADRKRPLIEVIMEKVRSTTNLTDERLNLIKKKVNQTFLPHYRARWTKQRLCISKFQTAYSNNFLNNTFNVNFSDSEKLPGQQSSHRKREVRRRTRSHGTVGRPIVPYQQASQRTKYKLKNRFPLQYQTNNNTYRRNQAANKKVRDKKDVSNVKNCDAEKEFLDKCLANYLDSNMNRNRWEDQRKHNVRIFNNNKMYPH